MTEIVRTLTNPSREEFANTIKGVSNNVIAGPWIEAAYNACDLWTYCTLQSSPFGRPNTPLIIRSSWTNGHWTVTVSKEMR
jgi:hypothetical protein